MIHMMNPYDQEHIESICKVKVKLERRLNEHSFYQITADQSGFSTYSGSRYSTRFPTGTSTLDACLCPMTCSDASKCLTRFLMMCF